MRRESRKSEAPKPRNDMSESDDRFLPCPPCPYPPSQPRTRGSHDETGAGAQFAAARSASCILPPRSHIVRTDIIAGRKFPRTCLKAGAPEDTIPKPAIGRPDDFTSSGDHGCNGTTSGWLEKAGISRPFFI